jgi:DNA-binding transcriptional LysR family regulator
MRSTIDTRLLLAAIVLADELHFGRAAQKLHIAVSTLGKQIAQLEEHLGFILFTRNSKGVDLTEAGRAYVEEARASLLHAEKAINVARAANDGREHIIAAGHTPYTDPTLKLMLLSIYLPLYPNVRVQLHSDFSFDLVHSLLAAELNVALIAWPPEGAALTLVEVAKAPLYIALPQGHPCSEHPDIRLDEVGRDPWILFNRRIHPLVYDALLQCGKNRGVVPKDLHHIVTAQEAVHLVKAHAGVAFMSRAVALNNEQAGVVMKPVAEDSLVIKTHLALRADEPSRMVNEFARAFLRKCAPQAPAEAQLRLPIQ